MEEGFGRVGNGLDLGLDVDLWSVVRSWGIYNANSL
jgi:hypothetical protein